MQENIFDFVMVKPEEKQFMNISKHNEALLQFDGGHQGSRKTNLAGNQDL